MRGVFCTRAFTASVMGEPRPVRELVRRATARDNVFLLTQVHGDRIVMSRDADGLPEADGIISDDPDDMLGILTADCLPVLAWSDDPPLIGALHAGWRGLAQGIVLKGVRRMQSLGAHDIQVSLGPAIGPCCFEVGPDVAAEFPGLAVPHDSGRPHLDLWKIAFSQAVAAGVDGCRIKAVRLCTMCQAALFFSYRREGYAAGRNISLIGGLSCSLPGLQAG